jgi:hypothetical protein
MGFQATINEIITFYHLQRKLVGATILFSWKQWNSSGYEPSTDRCGSYQI